MTFAKKVAARLAQFTLLLAFVGLTSLPGFAQERATQPHIGLVQDWSHRHIVFTDTNDVQTRVKQGSDLRALSSWARRTRVAQPNTSGRALVEHQDGAANNTNLVEHQAKAANNTRKRNGGGGSGGGAISGVSVDWALPLGKGIGSNAANYGGLAAGAYPAKYSFNINANPNCTNDYIAMGLNTPGSATTPNVVGINNLYSNAGGTGFCTGLTSPTAYFAYYTAAANPTSVVVSLDGSKIAWVENAATAVFHVLAWKASDGTLAAPVQLSLHVVAAAPVEGSGTMTSLTLASTDTNSSPYYDYTNDVAYVGNNNGQLFKIRNVFCQTIASPGANSTCAGAQPSLDPGWATNPVTILAGQVFTSPVVDTYLATPLVFVGASGGTVRARIASSGAAPTTPTLTPGAGGANGGIVDPPVLDVTNHKLYVTTGCNAAATNAVAVQNPYTATGFGTSVTANIGQDTTGGGTCPAAFNAHAGTPDDAYITTIQNGTAGTGNMIFCGTTQAFNGPPFQAVLYRFPVAAGVMSTSTAVRSGTNLTDGMGLTAGTAECSSVTDVSNANFAAPTERVYMGIGGTTDGHLRSFDAAFATPAASLAKALTGNWSNASGVITFPVANSPITIGPGNYVTIAATVVSGTCTSATNGTFEVASSTTTQITFNNPAVTPATCTGNSTGNATSDSTIPGISLVDITTPLVAQTTRATSGIIIDNVKATGTFAEASNIYFTQLAAGNIAGGSCPATATITTITGGGTAKTVTTSAAHGLAVGDSITISGNATAALNGVWFVATTATGTTFTFTGPFGSTGNGGSVFAKSCIYKLSQSGLQ